jgi:acetylornithine deacetylase/succinyl-diaminopimelate desuccinylase-like protein
MDDVVGEVTGLLQHLIRNRCVNDGTPASGREAKNADLLAAYLDGSGIDIQRYEPFPGRANLVARIEGHDPSAPTLLLLAHTDVVPANEERWRRDPFGGELVDGEVWGRGAVDMLNLTASMAVALRRLAADGFRPRGTLVYAAVADEEALGTYGAGWVIEHVSEVRADFVVTESGGFRIHLPSASPGVRLPVMVAEKGAYWCTLRIRGTGGHASAPLRTDNALVRAAEVVRRLAKYRPAASVHEVWRRFVTAMDFPVELNDALLDPEGIRALVESYPDETVARVVHACTHTTLAPTILRGGVKTNVIPDAVDLQLDIRTLPGQSGKEVRAMLDDALGDLAAWVEVAVQTEEAATESAIDTPLWGSLARVAGSLVAGAANVPFMMFAATDARFFRRAGATAYGYGLFSDRIPASEYIRMFHGDDERVDQESLRLSTALWGGLARDLLG